MTSNRPIDGEVERPILPHEPDHEPHWGSDGVVQLLQGLGVTYLPMNPGSSFRGLHDSVVNYGANHSPQLLLCMHEEIAVSIANGWSKATGKLGVVAIHDLVGLMHASMAIYDAYCDRTPMVILGGSGPADPALRRPIDWVHTANTQAQLIRDYVVWDAEPTTAQAFVDDVATAAQRATSVPSGPTYVSLDAGVQEAALDERVVMPRLSHRTGVTEIAAPEANVRRAAELLASASRPAVVAGRVGLAAETTELLTALVELLGAAYHDDRNWVAMPTMHPQNCSGDPAVVHEADVVLAIDVGDINRMTRPARGTSRSALPTDAGPMIIDLSCVDLDRRAWSNVLAQPVERDVHLLAEPLHGLRQLLPALRERVDEGRADANRRRVTSRAARTRQEQRDLVKSRWDDNPISQARLVAELWTAVRDVDHLLCLRNTRSWPEGWWEFSGSGSYLGAPAGGGIGYGPGALVGGALAARDRGQLGVAIVGDGDLSMAPGALWTASHYRIPAVVVVNNNGSFYNDEPHQAQIATDRGRPQENSWIGMRVFDPPVDFAAVAQGFGCHGIGPVDRPDDLPGALTEAVSRALGGATVVVDVHTARG